MVNKPCAAMFAEAAYAYRDSGIPYSKLDCQGFVERILAECGIRKDWRGSNHMWRDALSWKGTVQECELLYGAIPAGAWLFTVKEDGGERKRGYNDSEGNAAHVGIFCGASRGVMHSTTGGVQLGKWPDAKRWTHVGLCKLLDYSQDAPASFEAVRYIDNIISQLEELKRRITLNEV